MRTANILLVLVCAASLAVPAQEAAGSKSAATIRALEHAWLVAQARNDNRALALIFDNALVYVEYGRLLRKAEYLSRIRTENPHPHQIVFEPMVVHTFGSTAIVVGTYQEKTTKQGKSVQAVWRFVDTWVYKKGSWVLVAAAAAPLLR
jgi:ketosteroid isomerase-like protein